MRLLLATVLCATAPALALAQDIQIAPRLVAGDEFRLEIVRSRDEASRPEKNYSSRTRVDVKVVSAGPTGFVIDWKPGISVIEGSMAAIDPVLRVAGKAVGDVELRIALGPDGGFDGVANEKEVLPKLQSMVDLLIRESGRDLPEADAKKAEVLVRSILTPANLITLATQDVQMYVSMFGAEMAVGGEVSIKMKRPSPLGGEPLPAVLNVRMRSATPEMATLESVVTYDSDALRAMTAGVIAQAGASAPAEEIAKLKFEMSDNTKYVFDRQMGLFREVTNERRIASGELNRVDRLSIKLTTPPRR